MDDRNVRYNDRKWAVYNSKGEILTRHATKERAEKELKKYTRVGCAGCYVAEVNK